MTENIENKMIRVMVVDDQRELAEEIKSVLEVDEQIKVVYVAGDPGSDV